MERPDTRNLWNANAPAWTELSRAGFDVNRDLVNTPGFFEVLPAVSGLSCLDLGCGEGHNTRLLAARGARVTALDVAEVFVGAAAGHDRLAASHDQPADGHDHHGIRYVLGDGAALPFRASSFDAVTRS